MLDDRETIAARSTALGVGALSIVRISGPKTRDILETNLVRGAPFDGSFESHHAYFGLWRDPESHRAIDQTVVIYYSEGRGFTGEESAEVICHGGIEITQLVLESMLKSGARLARPGEFTYRAVMNGKLDLPQAESILSLIEARAPKAAARALKNLQGALSRSLGVIENDLRVILAHLEASIDFAHEDIKTLSPAEIHQKVKILEDRIENLLRTYVPAQISQRGYRVVLIGPPNAGKSSLFNGLLGRDRSIVDPNPGTTRDTVEAELKLCDEWVRLVDTAGLRQSKDSVEAQGVFRARQETAGSDIVIYVVDSSMGLANSDAEELKALHRERTLVCFNKNDIKRIDNLAELKKFGLGDMKFVNASASSAELSSLTKAIGEMIQTQSSGDEIEETVSTLRQKEGLERANSALKGAVKLLEENVSPDLVALDLREAFEAIQKVQGKSLSDDVMNEVFRQFCIGK